MAINKLEFTAYKDIIEGTETKETLQTIDPEGISKLGAEIATYYARVSNEVAVIKDEIDKEFLTLIGPDGKLMAMGRAEKEAEVNVNARHEVSRRELEYLLKGMDKIGFSCSTRIQSFKKEGSAIA